MAYPQLAGAGLFDTKAAPIQIFAGEAPIVTDAAPTAVSTLAQYQVVALLPAGTLTTFLPGTHTAAQAVITAIAATAVGQQIPYYAAGFFNHAALVWPAGTALDTYAERKQFFQGTDIHIGHITP